MIIASKFPGSCSCGARFPKGTRVNWQRGAGVVKCPACALKRLSRSQITVRGVEYNVAIMGRNGAPVRVGVAVNTAESFGLGALNFDGLGKLTGIGAHGAMGRGDLADYIPGATEAAAEALAQYSRLCRMPGGPGVPAAQRVAPDTSDARYDSEGYRVWLVKYEEMRD